MGRGIRVRRPSSSPDGERDESEEAILIPGWGRGMRVKRPSSSPDGGEGSERRVRRRFLSLSPVAGERGG
jgi:hypothetical protein